MILEKCLLQAEEKGAADHEDAVFFFCGQKKGKELIGDEYDGVTLLFQFFHPCVSVFSRTEKNDDLFFGKKGG